MRRLPPPAHPRTVRDLSDAELESIVLQGEVVGTPTRRKPGPRLPRCPSHLNPPAAAEWRRIARALQQAGVLTTFDRAALAAYCQAWGRWIEAEERLRETPHLVKTPSGYVQQSPWLTIVHKQLEIMGRYMVELGLKPAARSRVMADGPIMGSAAPLRIERIIISPEDRQFT
jgi:P27 family predicted phage terminase small subunit